jgi:hypothetical protein
MTMDQAERFSERVGEIYDAALDPSLPHPEVAIFIRCNSTPRGPSLMLALSWRDTVELAPYLSRTVPAAERPSAAFVSGIADPNARLRG